MSWIETSRAFDADNMGGNESNPVVLKEKHQGVTIGNRSKSVTDMLLIHSLFVYDKVRNFPRRVWCPSNSITEKREKVEIPALEVVVRARLNHTVIVKIPCDAQFLTPNENSVK